MDIEFHYYMTYLIATKAGIKPENALTLAHTCQLTDDNDKIYEISMDSKSTPYRNFISQTIDITKPKDTLFRIYVLFHFIPGEPKAIPNARKDGLMHCLNTTPASQNATDMLDAALKTQDWYRIGIACHAFADTFAHQNFVGYYTAFNGLGGPVEKITPDIGHADARHAPDWPALIWEDERLLTEQVENCPRFLEAARALFKKLAAFTGVASPQTLEKELLEELKESIGEQDDMNHLVDERTGRYTALAGKSTFGGIPLPDYDQHFWIDEAVHEDVRGIADSRTLWPFDFTIFPDIFTWKDPATYQETNWYRFQEAVKAHQEATWNILKNENLKYLRLPNF